MLTVAVVQTPPVLLRRVAAAAYMGISTALFDRLVAQGKMPKQRLISKGTTGWLRTELDACAHALPVSDLPPGPGRRKEPQAEQPAS